METVSIAELRRALSYLNTGMFGPDMLVADDQRAELTRYATTLSVATKEVNERLYKCHQLLTIGQRSEAIRQALLEPDLLTRYGELDQPRLAQWAEFTARAQLPVPSAMNKQSAITLNQAFAAEENVKPLLQQLRVLSLARAPMELRLNTLRVLVQKEPTHLGLSQDLANFERVRCDEIRQQVKRLRQTKDAKLAAKLKEEVSSPQWVNKPPLELIDAVYQAAQQAHIDEITQAMHVLEQRMNDAIRDQDFESAEAIRMDVETVADEFNIPDNDPLLDRFQEPFGWIDEYKNFIKKKKKFDKVVNDLTVAMQSKQEWWYIEQLYHDARSHRMDIPDDVMDQYHDMKQSRGMLKKAMVVGGIVIFVVVVIGFLLLRR